ncbi:MAG: NADPH-dependent F420 reductase [Burkholderiales bacterium]|nr:NADPH-dependent F420 reductase [Burkholderiales bacterium]
MKVTVIGSGNMGSGFVKQLKKAGHDVRVTGRNAEKAQQLAAQHGARAVSATEAAASDVLILATGYDDAVPALKALGALDGKVVVDVTNPLTADYMGLTVGHTTSAAEEIAKAVPNAHVVKAFNTVFASVLAEGASLGGGKTVPVFVASDDAPAKATVSEIARSIGFDVVGAGALKNARYLEPLAGLNIYLGYGAGLGTNIAPAWLRQG